MTPAVAMTDAGRWSGVASMQTTTPTVSVVGHVISSSGAGLVTPPSPPSLPGSIPGGTPPDAYPQEGANPLLSMIQSGQQPRKKHSHTPERANYIGHPEKSDR